MFFICFNIGDEFVLPTNEKGEAHAFETYEDGENVIRDSYDTSSAGSASIMIHFMKFNPKIIELTEDELFDITDQKSGVFSFSSICGSTKGFKLIKSAYIIYESSPDIQLYKNEYPIVENGEVVYPQGSYKDWNRRNTVAVEVTVKRLLVFDHSPFESNYDTVDQLIDELKRYSGRPHAWFDSLARHEEITDYKMLTDNYPGANTATGHEVGDLGILESNVPLLTLLFIITMIGCILAVGGMIIINKGV